MSNANQKGSQIKKGGQVPQNQPSEQQQEPMRQPQRRDSDRPSQAEQDVEGGRNSVGQRQSDSFAPDGGRGDVNESIRGSVSGNARNGGARPDEVEAELSSADGNMDEDIESSGQRAGFGRGEKPRKSKSEE